MSKSTHASSPSQSRLVAACMSGCANNPCVFVNPMMRPIMPALVCGARTMVRCPTRSCGCLML